MPGSWPIEAMRSQSLLAFVRVHENPQEAMGSRHLTDNVRHADTPCPHWPSSTYTRPSVASMVAIERRNKSNAPPLRR